MLHVKSFEKYRVYIGRDLWRSVQHPSFENLQGWIVLVPLVSIPGQYCFQVKKYFFSVQSEISLAATCISFASLHF